jgi:glucose-6-phosphate isomerase
LGIHGDAVQLAINKMAADKVNARIWGHDGSVWKDQPNVISKIETRLGWLDTDKTIDIERLKKLQSSIKEGSFSQIVLLGMGGSSLAPEVLYQTFGRQAGFPEFHVLDSTDPTYIRYVESLIDVKKTLFIVSSKSGGTIETAVLAKYFYAKAGNNGKQFIAITDASSSLEADAKEKGYLDIFLNPADIGGRYSALSYFGMVPAAAMGLDLDKLSAESTRMIKACSSIIPEQDHPGILLGAIIGIIGQQGRDKVTIQTSASIASFGNWIEQLIAESTGKEGKGMLPVVGATVGNPHDYSSDRLFVYLKVDDDPSNEEIDNGIRTLREAGHPRATFYLPNKYSLAGEFFRWEYATAIIGKILEINPFDEPNVTESKENTARLLTYYQNDGLPYTEHAFKEGNVELFADEKMLRLLSELCLQHSYNSGDVTGMLAAFINSTMAGDYFALQAYLPMTPEMNSATDELRRRLRHTTRRAVTLGYGPRFLHSTGQFHKGGPNSGNFIQITCDDVEDLDIPGENFTFGILKAAQAAGDLESLRHKDRRAIRLHISGNTLQGLDILKRAIDLVDERRK